MHISTATVIQKQFTLYNTLITDIPVHRQNSSDELMETYEE